MKTPDWKIPVPFEKVSPELFKALLSQAESRQKDLDSAATSITARVQNLISLLTAVMIASIGFLLSHLNDGPPLLLPTIAGVVYSYAVLFLLRRKAYAGLYKSAGLDPEAIFTPENFPDNYPEQDKHIYAQLLESYQERLTVNAKENARRWRVLDGAVNATVYLPLVLLVIFLATWAVVG